MNKKMLNVKLEEEPKLLQKYGSDLAKLAQQNSTKPLIGREQQIKRVMQILCKRDKWNPCLIGDAIVSDAVIVEPLASMIAGLSVPPKLQGKRIFYINIADLMADTSSQGKVLERLTGVFNETEQNQGAIILYIDQLHTLMRSAGTNGGDFVAANLLKLFLTRGNFSCILATTVDDYRKYISNDEDLDIYFQSVEVLEPSVAEATEILQVQCKKYETYHNVVYQENALAAAVELSQQFSSELFLLEKAIELIDEAGSGSNLSDSNVVGESDIYRVVATMKGIPLHCLSADESIRLSDIEERLQTHVIGQEEAVELVSRAVQLSVPGVRNPARPVASFLFIGPPGVGKTDLAEALAIEYYGSAESLIRVDVSEKHSLLRLFGSRSPHSVILCEDIEKAHPYVANGLLRIVDDGSLVDWNGERIDFCNSIVILTSSVDQKKFVYAGSLYDPEDGTNKLTELSRMVRVGLLDRIGDVVVFKQRAKEQLEEMVEIMVKQLSERMKAAKGMEVKVSDSLKKEVVEKVHWRGRYGAKSLTNAFAELVEYPLAGRVLGRRTKVGRSVTLT